MILVGTTFVCVPQSAAVLYFPRVCLTWIVIQSGPLLYVVITMSHKVQGDIVSEYFDRAVVNV